MTSPLEPTEFPKPSAGWWEKVPVLRELHKLLSERGAINWELARQVASALAAEDEPTSGDIAAEMETLTRGAEVACEKFTGLTAASVAPVTAVSRAEWAEESLAAFASVMEPLAGKIGGGGLPFPLPEQAQAVLRQITGIVMGLQTGFVAGYLARHVVGGYETFLPDPKGGRIVYVTPNIAAVEQSWSLDPQQFRYWVALHEVSHHVPLSRGWVRTYLSGQLKTLVESLDFDPSRMGAAFESLELLDPEQLASKLEDPEALFGAARTPLSQDALNRVQAFLTLTEGWSAFVMDAVGAEVLSEYSRLREVTDRRKREASPGDLLLERLCGLKLERKQYEQGTAFCRYVAGMRDVASLNRVWDNPDSLPTGAELTDPDGWIERVL